MVQMKDYLVQLEMDLGSNPSSVTSLLYENGNIL